MHEIQQSLNNLYIFLDYCEGGDLKSYAKKHNLEEHQLMNLLEQFLKGYKTLYDHKFIHRDIKPENLLIQGKTLKIGDFGFSRLVEWDMNEMQKMSRKCTPIYASP